MDSKINPRKRSRKTIQLIKHRIKREYEDGARVKDLAEKYNYAQITMARLLGDKQKLRKLENNTIIMEMEKLLFDWIRDKQKRNEPVTDTAIIQRAIKLYDVLMAETSNTSTIEGFRAHESWFNRFCRDAGIEIDKVTRLVKKDLKEKEAIRATSESGTSTSEDYPIKQKGIVDEVDDAVKSSEKVTNSSNSIYIQETYKETKDCPPHKISNCSQYLNNNDNIESEFDSSVSNEHVKNNNRDSSTLLSTLPPSRTPIENIKENSTPLRAIPIVTGTRIENNIKDNSALLRTIPTSTLTRIENINDSSTLSRTLLTPTLTRIENNINDNSTLSRTLPTPTLTRIENNNIDNSTLSRTLPTPTLTCIGNIINDSSTLIRTLPTPTLTRIENNNIDNSTLSRTLPTPTLTRIENNINDNSTLIRTLPTPTLTRIENNIIDNSTLSRTVPTRTHCHSSVNISEKTLNSENRFEDEFEAFGKYVAMSLRKMPLSNALSVENQIYGAINSERRLILLQENKNGINIGEEIKMEVEEEPI
ncbi:UNVERIFIED_CONTAM: hypothetical protein RMT77_008018 [Armadillidium vulgare]